MTPIQTTNRVLCLPGGGTKGYLQLMFINILIQNYPFTNPFHTYFDVICGTSVGAINALGLAAGKPIVELENFFLNEAKWIFTIRTSEDVVAESINASLPSNTPDDAQMVALLVENDPFYESVDVNSNYGSSHLYSVIDQAFGTTRMNELNNKVLIVSYDTDTSQPVLFSNYTGDGYQGATYLVSDIAKASSAAPIYLPTYNFGGVNYTDGGLPCNAPLQEGLTLGKRIGAANGKDVTRNLVLNIGTGLLPPASWESNFSGIPFLGSTLALSKVLKATLSGSNILSANDMKYRDKYTTEDLFFYNFDPTYNTTTFSPSLDNSSPGFFAYLQDLANQWYLADKDNLDEFMGKFFA